MSWINEDEEEMFIYLSDREWLVDGEKFCIQGDVLGPNDSEFICDVIEGVDGQSEDGDAFLFWYSQIHNVFWDGNGNVLASKLLIPRNSDRSVSPMSFILPPDLLASGGRINICSLSARMFRSICEDQELRAVCRGKYFALSKDEGKKQFSQKGNVIERVKREVVEPFMALSVENRRLLSGLYEIEKPLFDIEIVSDGEW